MGDDVTPVLSTQGSDSLKRSRGNYKEEKYGKTWLKKPPKHYLIIVTFLILTGKDNKEDDGNVNEEELEVSEVTEDLKNKNNRQHRSETSSFIPQLLLIEGPALRTE